MKYREWLIVAYIANLCFVRSGIVTPTISVKLDAPPSMFVGIPCIMPRHCRDSQIPVYRSVERLRNLSE